MKVSDVGGRPLAPGEASGGPSALWLDLMSPPPPSGLIPGS